MIEFNKIEDRKERMRARLKHFGSPLLSKETIEKMVDAVDIVEKYENLYIEPIRRSRVKDDNNEPLWTKAELKTAFKPTRRSRVKDDNNEPLWTKAELKKALKDIREDLGLPDFRHKMWKH